jgi:hypothetical protein
MPENLRSVDSFIIEPAAPSVSHKTKYKEFSSYISNKWIIPQNGNMSRGWIKKEWRRGQKVGLLGGQGGGKECTLKKNENAPLNSTSNTTNALLM